MSGESLVDLGRHRKGLAKASTLFRGETCGPVEAVSADHVKPLGRDVEEVASDELAGGKAHHLGGADAVVLVSEADVGAVEGEEATLADGATVEVSAEVVEDGGGVVVALSDVDVPALVAKAAAELVDVVRRLKWTPFSGPGA